jgi:hypothetical protein
MQANTELANSRLMGGLIGLIAQIAANEKAGSARVQLASTPRYVDVPVYADYQFDRARIAAARTMTVHYYVIDRGAGTYFKSTFDVVEEQQFRVSYNVHEKDPDRASISPRRRPRTTSRAERMRRWSSSCRSLSTWRAGDVRPRYRH